MTTLVVQTAALDFKMNRMQSMRDSWHGPVLHTRLWKHQRLVLTSPFTLHSSTSSIFIHIPKNRTQSLDQLREQHSVYCLTWYNFPVHQKRLALQLLSGKQVLLWNGTVEEIIGTVTGKYQPKLTKNLPEKWNTFACSKS